MKTCTKCNQTKELSEYYSDKRASDGKASMCKICNLSYRTKNVGKNAHLKEIPDEPAGMRYCTACKTIKTLDDFDTETHTKRGKTSTHHRRQCKACRVVEVVNYHRANPEVRRNANARLLEKNPTYYTDYRAKNHSELLRKARDRYRADPIKADLQVKNARAKRPDHYKLLKRGAAHTRRTRHYNLPTGFTIADWHICLDYFHQACAVCGQKEDKSLGIVLSMDHWIPVASPDSLGHVSKNVVPLCHKVKLRPGHTTRCCNNSKGAKDPVAWLKDRFPQDADDILARITAYFETLV